MHPVVDKEVVPSQVPFQTSHKTGGVPEIREIGIWIVENLIGYYAQL
jgi:hypothetical protein